MANGIIANICAPLLFGNEKIKAALLHLLLISLYIYTYIYVYECVCVHLKKILVSLYCCYCCWFQIFVCDRKKKQAKTENLYLEFANKQKTITISCKSITSYCCYNKNCCCFLFSFHFVLKNCKVIAVKCIAIHHILFFSFHLLHTSQDHSIQLYEKKKTTTTRNKFRKNNSNGSKKSTK